MSVSNHSVIEMQAIVGMVMSLVGVVTIVNMPEWVALGFFGFVVLFGYIGKVASDHNE